MFHLRWRMYFPAGILAFGAAKFQFSPLNGGRYTGCFRICKSDDRLESGVGAYRSNRRAVFGLSEKA